MFFLASFLTLCEYFIQLLLFFSPLFCYFFKEFPLTHHFLLHEFLSLPFSHFLLFSCSLKWKREHATNLMKEIQMTNRMKSHQSKSEISSLVSKHQVNCFFLFYFNMLYYRLIYRIRNRNKFLSFFVFLAMEEKASGCQLLSCFAADLEECYFPYVIDVSTIYF